MSISAKIRYKGLNYFYSQKLPLDIMDPDSKDVDFFLNVLKMFRGWLVAAKDRLSEKKDENESAMNELQKMLGK